MEEERNFVFLGRLGRIKNQVRRDYWYKWNIVWRLSSLRKLRIRADISEVAEYFWGLWVFLFGWFFNYDGYWVSLGLEWSELGWILYGLLGEI